MEKEQSGNEVRNARTFSQNMVQCHCIFLAIEVFGLKIHEKQKISTFHKLTGGRKLSCN